MKVYVKLFESWLMEATTEASPEDIGKMLPLVLPVIRKSVDDTMRFELEYAKKINDAKDDNERKRFFTELNEKRQQAEEPLIQFITLKAKVSQTQLEKIMSWAKDIKSLLINKEMSTMENDFKNAGSDVSKWKEMYDQRIINNEILKRNQRFEQEMGVRPPLVT